MTKKYSIVLWGIIMPISLCAATKFPKDIFYSCGNFKNHVVNLLSHYKRPITVLEIGTSDERLSYEIAKRFDATCVMIEWGNKAYELRAECIDQQLDNIILLGSSLSIQDFQLMSECEHFDVVLVHDSLSRFGDEIFKAVYAIINMGDYIIVKDTPDSFKCQSAFRTNATVLNYCYFFVMRKASILRTAWNKTVSKPGTFRIESTFEKKKLYKGWGFWGSTWIKGINLYTFKGTHALYPTMDHVIRQVSLFTGTSHNDVWIGNMVIQGKRIKLIDFKDRRRHANPKSKLRQAIYQLQST